MPGLIEIAPGLWARPEDVKAVRAQSGRTRDDVTLKPAVFIYIVGCNTGIGWEFDAVAEAKAWAGKIALAVNDALKGGNAR